jgi:hypothetical protein
MCVGVLWRNQGEDSTKTVNYTALYRKSLEKSPDIAGKKVNLSAIPAMPVES